MSVATTPWPVGGWETGELLRQKDWAKTPLGPIEDWPQSLKTAVDICLGSKAPIGIYWGPEHVLIYNDAWSALAGERHPATLGRPAREVFPEIWESIGPQFEHMLATGEAASPVIEAASPSENEATFEYSLSPIRGEDGTVTGIFNMVRDVSGRREAERRLRQSEQRLADFFENVVVGLHWVGPDGIIQRVNQAELDLLGYSREEYVGRHIAEFHVDQGVIEDILERLASGEELHDYPARMRHKDGSIRHVLISSNVNWEEDSFAHTRCITRDVTDRMQQDSLLREQKRLLEMVASGASLEDSLSALCEALSKINPGVRAAVLLPDRQHSVFDRVIAPELPRAFREMLTGADIDDLETNTCAGKAARRGEPVACSSMDSAPHWSEQWRELCAEHGLKACLSYPILDERDAPLAVLMLCNDASQALDAGEDRLVDCGTDITRLALERERSQRALRRSRNRLARKVTGLERLHDLTARLQMQEDVDAALCEVMETSAELLDADRASVQRYDAQDDVLKLVGTLNFDRAFEDGFHMVERDGFTTCAASLRSRDRVLVEDFNSDPDFTEFAEVGASYGIRAAITTPLYGSDGQLFGVFTMYWQDPRRPSRSEMQLLDLCTQQAARQIERTRAKNEQERLFKEAEAERKQLAEVFRQAPSYMCILRGPEHVIERANDYYYELVGQRELLGKPVREALPEVEGQGFFEMLDRVYQTGEPEGGTDARILLEREPGRPPQECFVNFSYQPIRNTDGSVSGIFVQGVDLTERKRAERALARVTAESERQRRLYEAIISSTPDLVYVFDLDYRFTFINDALLKMWGRTLEESLGKRLLEVGYEPWHAEMHEREIDQVVSTKEPVRGEVPFPHATLGERIYDYILVPVLNADGEVEAVAGTTRDITERRRMEDTLVELNATLEERVRKRTRTIRELASTLTMAEQEERRRISQILHDDLQQLLYGIQLKMTFVQRAVEDSDASDHRSHVEDAISRLDDAIRTTRQLTVDLSPPVLQGEGLTDTLHWLQSQMQEQHALEVDIEAEHAFRIPDEDMRVLLFQIIRELLFNVVKHADTDHAAVELYEEAGHLVMQVTDHGCGFDMAGVEDEQASKGGFGLFSVRERLGLFGGRIEVDSTPGRGTRVTVYTTVTPER